MTSQWQNFLRNQGEWHGSFATINLAGEIEKESASVLSLESAEEDRLVRFRLRRFGPEGKGAAPISDHQQDYRSLGRQAVFFASGPPARAHCNWHPKPLSELNTASSTPTAAIAWCSCMTSPAAPAAWC